MNTRTKACRNFAVVSFFLVFSICSLQAETILSLDSLLFVYAGPDDGVRPLGPHTIVFYKINAEQQKLVRVWSLGAQSDGFDVRYYEKERLFIATSDISASKIYTIFLDSITNPQVIPFADRTTISQWRMHESTGGNIILMVPVNTHVGKGELTTQLELITVGDSQKRTLNPSAQTTGEVRLSGLSYYGRTQDIVPLYLGDDGKYASVRETVNMAASPVPDDLIQMKSSYGWNLILNEPDFRVILSVPWTKGLTEREVLIYNRIAGTWRSVMIPGAATSPELKNGWLVGVISDPDPLTDYEAHHGGPSTRREEIVVLNIQTGEQFTLHLGKRCKVLWIDDSDIYYATGKELYYAKIVDQKLVNPRLLVSGGKVWGINWAFPGTLKQ